jgi:hypothetical protein
MKAKILVGSENTINRSFFKTEGIFGIGLGNYEMANFLSVPNNTACQYYEQGELCSRQRLIPESRKFDSVFQTILRKIV